MSPVTESGVYEMTAAEYLADPVEGGSLSSTGAKRLLPPSCPALYRHYRDNPEHKQAFDLGHAAHALTLGVGAELVDIDADSYQTKAAREQRDKAYADGKTPVLPKERAAAQAMARRIHEHPTAGALLRTGCAEQVIVWRDPVTGIFCRAMLDWNTDLSGIGPVIVDVKTTDSAEPGAIARSVENFRYYQQDPFYSDGYTEVFGVEPAFLFVFVEKNPPHLVTVLQLPESDRQRGRERNRKAIDIYRRCVAADHWPGYSDDIVLNEAPGWAVSQHEAAWRRGDFDPTYQIGAA